MDKKGVLWKVFIPSHIECERGTIYGHVFEERKIICIESVVEDNEQDKKNRNPIGIWKSTKTKAMVKQPKNELWLEVTVSMYGTISCILKDVKNAKKLNSHNIVYSPHDLLSSYILTSKSSVQDLKVLQPAKEMMQCENVCVVVSYLLNTLEVPKTTSLSDSGTCSTIKDSSVISHGMFNSFCEIVFHPFLLLFLLIGKLFDNRCTRNSLAGMCLDSPSLTRQIRHRSSYLKMSLTRRENSPLHRLSYLDSCGRQLVDSMLGICLLIFMLNTTVADSAATWILNWADNVATSLTNLIDWFMGAPAGLKLNSQLTHFLGHFFLYHIYLWTGYLSLLRSVLGVMLQCSSVLGVIGVSAQLCLVQDIISMMTVHIYCFYVYAARLYHLQIHGLASLWRLFRGKKWNVLRHRVDSAVYDIDQLFVGTLLFTILLFLMPTTLLYYVFFLMLRLAVLICEGVLTFCVRFINQLPVYSLLMWGLGSNAVAGDVLFSVVPNSGTKSSLLLTMKPTHLSLTQLFKEININPLPPSTSDSFGTLLKKMAKGQLIYPWIEEANKSDKKMV